MPSKGEVEARKERQIRAFELRKAGQSYRTIAAQLGVSVRTAYDDIQDVTQQLNTQLREEAEQLRAIEVERLDTLLAALWGKATDESAKGQTFAVDRVLSIMERRAKLLGLDMPTKIAPTDPTGEHEYAAAAETLASKLAGLAAAATASVPGKPDTSGN